MENDLHLKLKKLVDSGIKLTPAKILFGVLFHEKLRGLSKHEQNQIALDAEVGFTTQTASTELSKGMELAPYVEVKECIRKLVGK